MAHTRQILAATPAICYQFYSCNDDTLSFLWGGCIRNAFLSLIPISKVLLQAIVEREKKYRQIPNISGTKAQHNVGAAPITSVISKFIAN